MTWQALTGIENLFLFFAFFKTFDNIPSDQSLKYVKATTKNKKKMKHKTLLILYKKKTKKQL